AGVTIGVPSVRDAGWADERELVRADPLGGLFLLDAGCQLRERTGGGDVTSQGLTERAAVHRSCDVQQRGFLQLGQGEWDGGGEVVGLDDRRGDEPEEEHVESEWDGAHESLLW
ncbi:MAG: hypothetical protein ABL983_05710, partial [Nitrospira sp.]